MLFKLIFKIGILAIEVLLGLYSFMVTDSLPVKFLFFSFSALIIAFGVAKLTNKILPSEKDFVSIKDDEPVK